MSKLPEGWRVQELLPDDPKVKEHQAYIKRIAEELSAIPRLKREVPNTWKGIPIENLTQEEREEFYFSQQEKSTQLAIVAQKTRYPEQDIDHLLRPMPSCVANPEAKSLDELTSKRGLSPEDVILEKGLKQGRGTLGQSEKGSVDSEKRAKGVQAFTYSEPAKLTEEQIKKLTKLKEIVNTPLEPTFPKDSLSFRAASWLKDKTGVWWW